MIRALAVAGFLVGSPAAQAASYAFCWEGANDYRIEGYIRYPDDATDIVTEETVTAFSISGWNGRPCSWSNDAHF